MPIAAVTEGLSPSRRQARRSRHRWSAGLMAAVLLGGSVTAVMGTAVERASATGATSAVTPGTVFVSAYRGGRVLEIPPGGTPRTVTAGALEDPSGLAVDAAGDLFIADGASDRVVEVHADGTPRTNVGNGLADPSDVAVDAAGDVFIADEENDRVVEVHADGSPQTTVGTGLSHPSGVAVDAAGDVFIADSLNDRVVEVPAGGGPQMTIDPGENREYNRVAVDAAGDIYVNGSSQGEFEGVTELPAGGGPRRIIGSGQDAVQGVAINADGSVVIGNDAQDAKVVEVAPGGCSPTVVTSGLDSLGGVAVFAPAPTFTADSPPQAVTAGSPYSYSYTAATPAGEPAASFRVSSGTLPPGLTLDSATGTLSGTPTTPGTYSFVAETNNAVNGTLAPTRTITVAAATPTAAIADATAAVAPSPTAVAGPVAATGASPEAPVITQVSPDEGPLAGGTQIQIYGSGIYATETATVMIGQGTSPGIAATDVHVGKGVITATTGGGARAGAFFHVYVTTKGGTSEASPHDVFAYVGPPTVTSVSPATGSVSVCQEIVVTGTGFFADSAVEIGQGHGPGATAIPATDIDVLSSTEITATTGGHARAGRYYLFVLGEGGTSTQENKLNAYTYTPASG